MKEQLRLTWLVARRELTDQMRDWRILLPMGILILFFPYLMNYTALQAIDFVNEYGGNLIAERIVPFLLMVVGFFPVTVSLIVALEAFVGEKERGTIEPMLSSPLADWHMYVGKLTAGSLVPLAASYISIALYLLGLMLQNIPFPPLDVLVQMLLLTAVQTVLMVSAAIIISTQSTSVRAANLLASFIVIPVALLIQGESALIFWGDTEILWLAILGVAIVTGLIVRLGLAHFQREALLGREIDMLNLRWAFGAFWASFSGSAAAPAGLRWLANRLRKNTVGQRLPKAIGEDLAGIKTWYINQVFPAVRRMALSIWLTVGLGALAILFSYLFVSAQVRGLTLSADALNETANTLQGMITGNGDGFSLSVAYLFFNNLRAEILILFFGMFSFGVGAVLIYGLNFALIGGVLAAMKVIGLSPWLIFLTGILPHGVFELPSIILASAAVLHMGVRMVTPNARESIGEVLIHTSADWLKIAIGLAFPLLFIAAFIETYITPILLYNFFQ